MTPGFISPVFYTADRKWSFQRCGEYYRLYNREGWFVHEFRSFKAMCDYLDREDDFYCLGFRQTVRYKRYGFSFPLDRG